MKHSELSPLAQKLREYVFQASGKTISSTDTVSPEWNKQAEFIQQLLDERTKECAETVFRVAKYEHGETVANAYRDIVLHPEKARPKWCSHYQFITGTWKRLVRYHGSANGGVWLAPHHDAEFCDICGAPRPKE